MKGDRNKEIELGGINLSKAEKLEICLARRLMSHIDTCTPHELVRIFRLILGDCNEAKMLEKELQ
jgi:hypothetical protein